MPRITVLMPVYNGMPYIPEAVDSVLSQSETDWQPIISDNGSKDGTRDYLRTLTDPRIRVHYQDTNLDIFGNLNFLLEQSRTDIAKILCADDVLLPGALARIAAFMEERPWCAVSRCLASGDLKKFGPGSRCELEGALPRHLTPAAAVLAFATFGNLVGNLSKAACRTGLVLRQGGFDQQFPYAGDYAGWLNVAAEHGLALQNEELVFERRHANQNSNLLNRKNELYRQVNTLIIQLSGMVQEQEARILRRHGTIHFFSPRLARAMRQVLAGRFRLATEAWTGLPLNISPILTVAAYPAVKFNLPMASKTTRLLYARICDLNGDNHD